MNIFATAGAATGLVIGIIIAVIIFKFTNTNHRIKTEYDERQQVLRGRGYMYSFYTMVVYECVMLVLSIGRITLPAEDYVLHYLGIILGCGVLGVYSVWNDVYWGLNNNRRRYVIIIIVLAVINLLPVIGSFRAGEFLKDGKLSYGFVNLSCLIFLAIFPLTYLIKKMVGKETESED